MPAIFSFPNRILFGDGARAELVAERLRKLIESQARICAGTEGNVEVKTTVSVGVANAPAHAQTVDALLEAADQALYRAKRQGRNCVVTAE